ncbi:hypothetical protein [Iningainema tapete]|uniref:Uncharacterized protein n=1 Tax=Iningainema tapete BLCC-T55 TaxID=2748662 RepID=A0A8J6XIK5_9CYAN|nr:hypothetical protein [Iningainema tapete]MBD2775103.1 hypothetical protein [Iningainema tapete BLCC-T55]
MKTNKTFSATKHFILLVPNHKSMTVAFKTLILALIVTFVGTVKCVQAEISHVQIAQAQRTSINVTPIVLALPKAADVIFTDGRSATGRVTEFDSKGQTIQISNSGESRKLPINQLSKVIFKRDALIYTSTGERVIRGEEQSKASRSIWDNIPLNAFRLINPSRGEASVDLSTLIMNSKRLREINSIAQNSLYVANEIEFKSKGKIAITVTPIDRVP